MRQRLSEATDGIEIETEDRAERPMKMGPEGQFDDFGQKGSLAPEDELKAQGFVLEYPDCKSKHTDNSRYKKGFLFLYLCEGKYHEKGKKR